MEENKHEVPIASSTDFFMSGSALMQNLEIENYSAASLPPSGQLHTASIIVDFMSRSALIQNLVLFEVTSYWYYPLEPVLSQQKCGTNFEFQA